MRSECSDQITSSPLERTIMTQRERILTALNAGLLIGLLQVLAEDTRRQMKLRFLRQWYTTESKN